MRLREDWKKFLLKAWSIRIDLLALVLSLCELALPIIDEMIYIPRGLFLALSMIVGLFSNLAQIIRQKEFHDE
ncbi:hypothetical protein EVB79_094 [Rhizobium phage RHph_N3_13]|nr:hypothetical protein EVB79_094 [Rhizobium phage RHph_N3_13]QIG69919.1 hypothetical protein F67_I3_11_093 [Rhizobium phage RHph_I3_11]